MVRETDRPSPVPCPTGLVVKNGSKIRRCRLSGMPGPLSLTVRVTRPAGSADAASAMPIPGWNGFPEGLGGVDDEVDDDLRETRFVREDRRNVARVHGDRRLVTDLVGCHVERHVDHRAHVDALDHDVLPGERAQPADDLANAVRALQRLADHPQQVPQPRRR